MKNQEWKGIILVAIAGLCWGIIGLFTRFLSSCGLNSIQITLIRNIVASLGMFLVIIVTNRERIKIRLRDIWMFIGTGIFSVALFNICYFKSIEMTTMSVAAVLLYTAPCLVVIMSRIFFKEKVTFQKFIALLLAFAGCIFTTGLIGENDTISNVGIIIGFGSGFGYALYSIFGSVALKKYHPFTVTFYTFLFATLALLPTGGIGKILEEANQVDVVITYVLLGIVSTLIPFLCYTAGLQFMEVGKASVMAFIEPLIATLCGIIFYKEKLTIDNMIGIVLIFISLILLNFHIKNELTARQKTRRN